MTTDAPRWHLAVAALGHDGEAGPTRRLLAALGPVEAQARLVGEPPVTSTRWRAGGVEVVLHDGVVVAVVLHLPQADLRTWAGAGKDATLGDLERAFAGRARFAGQRGPYVEAADGYARFTFAEGGWKARGNLRAVTFVAQRPGEAPNPEADDCPACADLPVRGADGLDVPATVAALAAALTSGRLREDPAWVRLADLPVLGASGLMERAESQLTCTTCGRVTCLTLVRGGAPTLSYATASQARRRPMGQIPPVEQWGDLSRVRQEVAAMHYVDHEPGSWFLVEQDGVLFLDARYSYSGVVDDSILVRLDAAELARHRDVGHAYLTELAERIHNSGPFRPSSPFYDRDLYRREGGRALRDAVSAAIVDHTWRAEQRRSG